MEEVLALLQELKPEVDFSAQHALVDDGILDSLDIITIIADVSVAFGIIIPPSDIIPENFNSVQSLFHLIQSYEER